MSTVTTVLLIEADRNWQNIIWANINDEYIQIVAVPAVEEALQILADVARHIDVVVVSDVTRGNVSRFIDLVGAIRRRFAGTIFAIGDNFPGRDVLSQAGCEYYVCKSHLAKALNGFYCPVGTATV